MKRTGLWLVMNFTIIVIHKLDTKHMNRLVVKKDRQMDRNETKLLNSLMIIYVCSEK